MDTARRARDDERRKRECARGEAVEARAAERAHEEAARDLAEASHRYFGGDEPADADRYHAALAREQDALGALRDADDRLARSSKPP